MKKLNIILVFIFTLIVSHIGTAQSFDEEKVSMTNFVQRMYQASPFEGGKIMEGEEASYHVVAIQATSSMPKENEKKAQEIAAISFAEPFVKFEMIAQMQNPARLLYYCQPLSKFIQSNYQKQGFDGARIVSSPNNNFFIAVVSLDPTRYSNPSLMDRAALMKSNQQANALFNGSNITSDMVIVTESTIKGISTTAIEMIREQSMGYIEGLAALTKFDANNKKVYVFYRPLGTLK